MPPILFSSGYSKYPSLFGRKLCFFTLLNSFSQFLLYPFKFSALYSGFNKRLFLYFPPSLLVYIMGKCCGVFGHVLGVREEDWDKSQEFLPFLKYFVVNVCVNVYLGAWVEENNYCSVSLPFSIYFLDSECIPPYFSRQIIYYE